MKIRFFLLVFFVFSLQVFATHNRAGEITYKHISGFTYEFTITTYTKVSAAADRCELTIEFGDGSSAVFIRENGASSPTKCPPPAKIGELVQGRTDIRKNIYRGQHTFTVPGYYTISVEDLNRNDGISNIPSSVLVPFYITTTVLIDPSFGGNSSPVLTYPPVDQGCTFKTFIHNPGAFDPDGDSLSYELIDCRGLGGISIPETYDPALVQDPVSINAITGDFLWDTPKNVGQYNFAILIREFRKTPNGSWQLLGSVTRDFQVDIDGCNNNPPVIDPLGPFCVEAGETLSFTVRATDPDVNLVTLTATGGPFEVNPAATFLQPTQGLGIVTQDFEWITECNLVRKQPYYAQFKAEDSNNSDPNFNSLSDVKSVEITVVAPAPKNLVANPINAQINVSWDPEVCTQAIGYRLYRREGASGFVPGPCQTGIPATTGYVFHATLNGINNVNYVDSLNLKNGVSYCYMVYAYFADGAESYASNEDCTELPKALPIITNVDVLKTSDVDGEMEIKWIPPREIDSAVFPPPYSYVLERAENIDGSNFTPIVTLPNYIDTTYKNIGINTQDLGYSYRVGLFSEGNLIAYSNSASSVYLDILPSDQQNILRFNYNVPWQNDTIVIYRETAPGSTLFDSIGLTLGKVYLDTGLVNGNEYCYKGKAIGRYSGANLPKPLINNSQIDCASPLDTNKPCAPVLTFEANCELGTLELQWVYPDSEFCINDLTSFNVYYKATELDPWSLVATLPASQLNYFIQAQSIVGCYAITAVDDAIVPNESDLSNAICLDGCPFIKLPNVFTPNGANGNDFYIPINIRDIGEFKIEIYNRWGGIVYSTESLDEFTNIGWDGKNQDSKAECADGVYFYLVTYKRKSTKPTELEYLKGIIHLFR